MGFCSEHGRDHQGEFEKNFATALQFEEAINTISQHRPDFDVAAETVMEKMVAENMEDILVKYIHEGLDAKEATSRFGFVMMRLGVAIGISVSSAYPEFKKIPRPSREDAEQVLAEREKNMPEDPPDEIRSKIVAALKEAGIEEDSIQIIPVPGGYAVAEFEKPKSASSPDTQVPGMYL
jgi:hypothetical protein